MARFQLICQVHRNGIIICGVMTRKITIAILASFPTQCFDNNHLFFNHLFTGFFQTSGLLGGGGLKFFKNADFSLNSSKVRKLSKFYHFFMFKILVCLNY